MAEVKDVKTSNKNNIICKEQEIELGGSTKYEIQYTEKKSIILMMTII